MSGNKGTFSIFLLFLILGINFCLLCLKSLVGKPLHPSCLKFLIKHPPPFVIPKILSREATSPAIPEISNRESTEEDAFSPSVIFCIFCFSFSLLSFRGV
ncbi:MAG: hypothetical protein PWP04_1780 [Candidatus Atribacteria bacterium]|nr:hypothetical protein [Candidatus Atribacteria bacterium]